MQAIISLLDETHSRHVELLWEDLRRRFGVTSGIIFRYPHISYLAAKSIDPRIINNLVAPIAATTEPLTIHASGLCLFTTKTPVIHIPVARTVELNVLHQRIWDTCSGLVDSPSAPFEPETWMPHITLAQEGINHDNLGEVVTWLAELDLQWTIPIDNLAVIDSEGERETFDFKKSHHADQVSTEA